MSLAHDTSPRLTVPEFLAWVRQQPAGRYELVNGEIVAMPAEGIRHNLAKLEVAIALREAVAKAGFAGTVLTDGMLVPISKFGGREPDAMITSQPVNNLDATTLPDPLILVEVTSPSSGTIDSVHKLAEYFSLASVRHYLLVDPLSRVVVVHSRAEPGDTDIRTRILSSGTVVLDPPGLAIAVERLFPVLSNDTSSS